MCYGFTGSNSANDGCYVNNQVTVENLGEMCSYDMSTFSTLNPTPTCNYCSVTGSFSSTLPSADATCEAGAVWGHPINNVLSTSTESSVRNCYFKCELDASCV